MQANDQVYQATAEAARDSAWADQDIAAEKVRDEKGITHTTSADLESEYPDYPSAEQRASLRRVPGSINLIIFTVAFIEFAERFSYYGCMAVLTNFIQFPLPEGSTTGSIKGLTGVNTPGALGRGQQAAFGITTFNTFWVYVTPLVGAYFADAVWGRFKTICVAIGIAIIGHILLIVCAIPSVISNSSASYGVLVIAIIVMGLGTGVFKSNISPLIAEQITDKHLRVKTLGSGEQVLVDPAMTVSRIMMYFYLLINAGALSGQIGMVFAEQDIGFWLSFTIPTIVFCLTPLVMIWGNKRYVKVPPQGSVMVQAFRLCKYAFKESKASGIGFIAGLRSAEFWQRAKPSQVVAKHGDKPSWMTFDDLWVEEVRRSIKACNVFLLYPLYWICYNQITSNLTSQAATMTRNGLPNDLINNLNPISLVIMIPLCDVVIYPFLRSRGIQFTPIKKITLGFFIASVAMMSAAITQHYIYETSPCGSQAATCDEVSPLNVWIQTPTYVLIGISEIFASITGLEYAFTKAAPNMRSLVTAVFLVTQSFSAALAQAFVPISTDPLLVWNYSVFAILSSIAGVIFWIAFRKLDKEENRLNDMRRNNETDAIRHQEGIGAQYGQAPAPATSNEKSIV